MDTRALELERARSKPKCKLTETNGNVFGVINLVSKSLKKNGQPNLAKEFVEKAFESKLFNEILILVTEYTEITNGDEN
jgi:hypothetical protein